MPAPPSGRQPGFALDWFAGAAGQGLVAVESSAVARILAGCPALPWVWIGAPAIPAPPAGRRGLLLRRGAGGLLGDLRCRLPLPLASETFGAVLLQHALDDDGDVPAMLGECARILVPGGTLWLAALNPWTPYRARWARTGLHARDPGTWQSQLRRAGFATNSVRLQWLGPHWRAGHGEAGVGARDRLRAGIALSVSKRAYGAIPGAVLRRLRWQPGAAASRPLRELHRVEGHDRSDR
jgi:hypothetical protein